MQVNRRLLLRQNAPKTFTGLMALYEQNYARMMRLLRDSDPSADALRTSGDGMPVCLTVLERSRYTTTFRMTYWFDDGEQRIADPDLEVRLYHDAGQAETTRCARNDHCVFLREFQLDQIPNVRQLEARWSMNMLLGKWLDYLLQGQHCFTAVQLAPHGEFLTES